MQGYAKVIIGLPYKLQMTESLTDFKLACSVYMPLASSSALVLFTILKAVLKDVRHLMDLRTYISLMYYVTLSVKNSKHTLLLIVSTEVCSIALLLMEGRVSIPGRSRESETIAHL